MEIDPSRLDIKFKLDRLQRLLENFHSRRRIRIIVAAAGALILVALLGIFLNAYLKKRKAFAEVQARAQALEGTKSFDRAITLWEDFLKRYPSGSLAEKARRAIRELQRREEGIGKEHTMILEKEQRKLRLLREKAHQLLSFAKELEAKGDFKGANEAVAELLSRFPGSPEAKAAFFVLRITSNPSGALVKRLQDGKALGKTPTVVHYKPGSELSFLLTRPGWENASWQLTTQGTSAVHVKLRWTALDRFKLPLIAPGRFVPHSNSVLTVSREGFLYRIDPEIKGIRWRRKVGEYGDPYSRFLLRDGKLFIGNLDGKLWCLDATTGKKIWKTSLPGPALRQPFITDHGTVISVTRNAKLCTVEDGIAEVRLSLYGSIKTDPIVLGDTLFLGTAADLCYAINLRDFSVKWMRAVEGDVTAGPLALPSKILVVTQENYLYACLLYTSPSPRD